jgi:hypothetical protein
VCYDRRGRSKEGKRRKMRKKRRKRDPEIKKDKNTGYTQRRKGQEGIEKRE